MDYTQEYPEYGYILVGPEDHPDSFVLAVCMSFARTPGLPKEAYSRTNTDGRPYDIHNCNTWRRWRPCDRPRSSQTWVYDPVYDQMGRDLWSAMGKPNPMPTLEEYSYDERRRRIAGSNEIGAAPQTLAELLLHDPMRSYSQNKGEPT